MDKHIHLQANTKAPTKSLVVFSSVDSLLKIDIRKKTFSVLQASEELKNFTQNAV